MTYQPTLISATLFNTEGTDMNQNEMDLRTAVGVCERVAEESRQHLEILFRQIANCQGCLFNNDCVGRTRFDRLADGQCHCRVERVTG